MKSNLKQLNSKRIVKALAAAFAIAGLGVGSDSFAATNTGAFAVTADVVAACTVSGSTLAFSSTINVLSATNVDATSALSAVCTTGSAYTVGLNAGLGGGTVTTRKMTHTNAVTKLAYNLSTLSSGGTNWDDVGGTTVASGTGNGAAQSITVYGRVPGSQTTAIVGAYSDTITATINF